MVIESVQRWDSAPVADPARSVTITCSVCSSLAGIARSASASLWVAAAVQTVQLPTTYPVAAYKYLQTVC